MPREQEARSKWNCGTLEMVNRLDLDHRLIIWLSSFRLDQRILSLTAQTCLLPQHPGSSSGGHQFSLEDSSPSLLVMYVGWGS